MRTAVFMVFVVAVIFSGAPAVAVGLAGVGLTLWWVWK